MMRLVLEKYGCVPSFSDTSAEVLVTLFDESMMAKSMSLASELRRAGIRSICMTETSKIAKQFKYADRIGVPIVLVMGPEEAINNEVTVKNLKNRSQVNIKRADAVTYLKNMLADASAV